MQSPMGQLEREMTRSDLNWGESFESLQIYPHHIPDHRRHVYLYIRTSSKMCMFTCKQKYAGDHAGCVNLQSQGE